MNAIYACPTDGHHLCSWEGPADNIYKHFIDEHEDLLLEHTNLDIDLQIPSENLLLFHNSEIYLVQYKIYNGVLNIRLRFLGSGQNASKISYQLNAMVNSNCATIFNNNLDLLVRNDGWEIDLSSLKFEEDGKQIITCKFQIDAHKLSVDDDDEEEEEPSLEEESTEFVEEPEKQLEEEQEEIEHLEGCKSDELTEEIDSIPREQKKFVKLVKTRSYTEGSKRKQDRNIKAMRHKSVAASLRKEQDDLDISSPLNLILTIPEELTENDLPCANCTNIMKPHIFLCQCGHSICTSCEDTDKQCLKCQKPSTKIRNKILEDISRKHLHACKYATNGCTDRIKYEEIVRHEMLCQFCTYVCRIDDCEIKDTYKSFLYHMGIFHKGVRLSSNLSTEFTKNSEFLIADNKKGIFYCKSSATASDIEWKVIFCGPEEHVFYCEMFFKSHKVFFKRNGPNYVLKKSLGEMKKQKIKDKHAMLCIQDAVC